jgi:hypothetical protein
VGASSETGETVPSQRQSEELVARRIREAGLRAAAEAEERRARSKADPAAKPKEIGGPRGLEPTRYGDWERKGLISDF